MNYNRIGKFLSLVLVNTQDLFIEVERVDIICLCVLHACTLCPYGAHGVVGVYIS